MSGSPDLNQVTGEQTSTRHARKLYDDFGRGDVEAVLNSFDPRIEWREAEGNPYQPDGIPFRGPEEVLHKLFARLAADWDGFTVIPETFHEAKHGVVVVEGRYRGTFRETGRDLDCEVCHVLRYEQGKLASFRQYVDTAQLRAVMGTG